MGDREPNRFAYLSDVDSVLARMTVTEQTARAADDEVLDLGFRARELGASWREVADSICITQQAAAARWGTDKSERGRMARRRRIQRLTELALGRKAHRAALGRKRRFIVADPSIIQGYAHLKVQQAYFWTDPRGYVICVQQTSGTIASGRQIEPPATLNLKGPPLLGGSRIEIENELSNKADSDAMISTAQHMIVKDRYRYPANHRANVDVDVYHGKHEGLIIAEFESTERSVTEFTPPPWCGMEVTNDPKFDNENLAVSSWPFLLDQARSIPIS